MKFSKENLCTGVINNAHLCLLPCHFEVREILDTSPVGMTPSCHFEVREISFLLLPRLFLEEGWGEVILLTFNS